LQLQLRTGENAACYAGRSRAPYLGAVTWIVREHCDGYLVMENLFDKDETLFEDSKSTFDYVCSKLKQVFRAAGSTVASW
jgi:hypothetical protein